MVLTGASGAAPADLLSGLSTRGVSTVVVNHPASVMVELAKQTTGAMVVVEPDRHPYLSSLIQAVGTYHPMAVRWGYTAADPSGTPQLRPLEDRESNHTPTETDETDDRPTGQGKYLVPDPKSPLGRAQAQVPRERVRSLVVKVQQITDADEPLISEEELAMLLGPMPDESGAPRTPGAPGGMP